MAKRLDVSCDAVPYVATSGGGDAVEQPSAKQGLERVEPAVDCAPA